MNPTNKVIHSFLLCATTAALSATSALARAEPTPPAPDDDRSAVTVGVVHPLATNANRPDVTTNVDLSILWGRVGKIEGAQIGGAFVSASRGVRGAQIGGAAAIAAGPVSGAQVAGAANVATEGISGAQVAPVNVAGSVDGVQLGVVNVGRRVRGLQVGLVNIADDVDGGAIGLVSISRNSVHPIVWASNLQYTNAGVKFSNKYVFTMVGAHYGTHETEFDDVGLTAAIGGHVPLPARFDLELQGSLTQLAPWGSRSRGKENTWVAPQIVGGYSVATHLRVFVGGGVRLPISVDVGREVTRPEVLAGLQF